MGLLDRKLKPWLRALAERAARLGVRQGRAARPPVPARSALVAQTDALNLAAERYYAERNDREYQIGKPFSDAFELPQYLFNAGTLIHWLRVGPGDTVAEIGAGPCWLSHFLHLYGAKTLAIDVSATALALGRERFERDPRTRWQLEPEFLTYDGHRLPLADGGCDRIVLHDAYHHLPNEEELLREMARVLRPGGIVAMSEPGRFHSQGEDALKEVAETGVLENDVVVEELAVLAKRCGFTRVTVVPNALRVPFEVEAESFAGFIDGRGMLDYWQALCPELLGHHYILLYKGEPMPTTRRPGQLRAQLALAAPLPVEVATGERLPFTLRLRNAGDTLWLGSQRGKAGWTRLGAHLVEVDGAGRREHDWLRFDLPGDLAPGESAEVTAEIPAFAVPGRYRIELDLVAEEITWFAERGSPSLTHELVVRA